MVLKREKRNREREKMYKEERASIWVREKQRRGKETTRASLEKMVVGRDGELEEKE